MPAGVCFRNDAISPTVRRCFPLSVAGYFLHDMTTPAELMRSRVSTGKTVNIFNGFT
jgi:hypothetical protein